MKKNAAGAIAPAAFSLPPPEVKAGAFVALLE
jgi:hypothetical protein